MRKRILPVFLFRSVLMLASALLLTTCIKEDFEKLNFVEAFTEGSIPVDVDAIRLSGRIGGIDNTIGLDGRREYGFVISESTEEPTLDSPDAQKISFGSYSSDVSFDDTLRNLSVIENYYFRAYVTLGNRTNYGDALEFTLSQNLQVGISDNYIILNDQAELNGELFLNFQGELSDHGFVYSPENAEPEIDRDSTVRLGPTNNDGPFEGKLENLDFNTVYHVRAFATINDDVKYSHPIDIETRDGWAKLGSVVGIIRDPVGVAAGPFGYAGIGCTQFCTIEESVNSNKPIWEFNPEASDPDALFTEKSRLPPGRNGAVAVAINGKVYFGLGQVENIIQTDWWEFDPASDSWTELEMDDFPGTPRTQAVAFVLNGSAYVGTGISGSRRFADFWKFDPSAPAGQRWRQLANRLPLLFDGEETEGGRSEAVAFTIGAKAYVGTGEAFGFAVDDIWEFDPLSEEWNFVSERAFPSRRNAIAFSTGNKGYVGFGTNGFSDFEDLWEFDPANPAASEKWIQKTALRQDDFLKTSFTFAFAIGDKGYVGGPNIDDNTMDIWEYTPEK